MKLEHFTYGVVTFLVGFICGLVVYPTAFNSSPVEKNDVVDSLVKANDSIKIVINNLDSIKDAEVIEVQSLDNDSTLKLFYKLVKD